MMRRVLGMTRRCRRRPTPVCSSRRPRVRAQLKPGTFGGPGMSRVSVTPEEAAFIQQRIERFAEEAPEELSWELPYVREHGALPLYLGWTETFGIRPDGELIRWSTEQWPDGAFDLNDTTWEKVAL